MIGESGGVTTHIYQEQVNRENQIQRDRGAKQETDENNSRQATADVTTFSAKGLELARTAVTETQAAPEAALERASQEEQVMLASEENRPSSAQHLDIRV